MNFPIPWEILYTLGAVVLLGAIVWGVMQNARRNRANDPVTEAAVRESYKHPEEYKQDRKEFEKQIRPS